MGYLGGNVTLICMLVLGNLALAGNWKLRFWEADEPTTTTQNPRECLFSTWNCGSGECISKYSVCDGVADCADKSDETEESCRNGSSTCHTFSYHCKYGACVGDRTQRRIRCDGTVDCVDGSDEESCTDPSTSEEAAATTRTQSSTVSEDDSHATTYVNDYVPKGRCPPLNDPSYTVICRTNQEINCSDAVEGSTATTRCATFFKQDYNRPRMTCINGTWTPQVGICYPECGKKRTNVKPTIIGGEQSIHGEYPWIIAIYNKDKNHICGGSLISRKYVLSAAHCFTDSRGGRLNKDDYWIAAGKHFRLFHDERDAETRQIRKIKEIHVFRYYRGYDSHFLHDIAVAEASKMFKLSLNVQPVCVDWNNQQEGWVLEDGKEGVVAGWGFTTDSDSPAESLKKLVVPYRSSEMCQKHLDKDYFDAYFTYDKICAGHLRNASNVCSGDSGGGYYFSSTNIFYVRGIVSSVQPTKAAICDQNNFAVYTRVSVYLSWLEEVTGKEL